MKLSIIIPVFNEENTVKEIIQQVENVPLSIEKEIIVVNDGSRDNTASILRSLNGRFNFIFLEHQKNLGKGAAIKTGLGAASGDFVIIQDADLEYNPEDYTKLIAPLLQGKAEVVYGSRILGKNKRGSFSFFWGGKFLTFLSNLLYGLKITDESTCYKAFKKDLLVSLNLESDGFEFCPEVTAKIGKRKIKIYDIPISYNARGKGEGKKIKWKDGFIAMKTLIKYKFKK
jgi:glycosyltransferase involved in cell wall biosynthesis